MKASEFCLFKEVADTDENFSPPIRETSFVFVYVSYVVNDIVKNEKFRTKVKAR